MHTPKKGIFKGLRYIAQIFDNSEKKSKSEFKIGLPTDVKHVAHIGWDGPSVHTPSWMSEFKPPTAPLSLNGNIKMTEPDKAVKWVPKDSQGMNLTELPKSIRPESTGRVAESPIREKSDRPTRQARKSSKPKDPSDPTRPTRVSAKANQNQRIDQSDLPKKTRRKKSKGSSGGSSTKTKSKTSLSDPNLGSGSPTRPVRKSRRPVEAEKGSTEELVKNLV